MKDTILLAGIGLIGGSIALAIKKEHPHKRIIGVDISEEQLTAALKLGIIDERAGSFTEGAQQASVVIIATPVAQTLKMLDMLAASGITHELLITDVGSTKQKVVSYADKVLPAHYQFVGAIRWRGLINPGLLPRKNFYSKTRFTF